MKSVKFFGAAAVAVLLVSASLPALAQTTDQDKAMEAYLQNMALNENHARLQFFAGSWDVKTTAWMAPGGEPYVSQNTCQTRLILGGRFFLTEIKGQMMGQPVEGLQVVGYDNSKGKYVTFWIDSTSTSFFLLEGTCDPEGKVFTDTAKWPDLLTGGETPVRAVTTILGPDSYKYELYMSLPGAPDFKSMENVYTRKK